MILNARSKSLNGSCFWVGLNLPKAMGGSLFCVGVLFGVVNGLHKKHHKLCLLKVFNTTKCHCLGYSLGGGGEPGGIHPKFYPLWTQYVLVCNTKLLIFIPKQIV